MKRASHLLKLLPVAACLWPWGGIHEDREFGERRFFIKHRPSVTFFFASPLGEGDLPPGGLRPQEAQAEADYVEFVVHGQGWRRSIPWL